MQFCVDLILDSREIYAQNQEFLECSGQAQLASENSPAPPSAGMSRDIRIYDGEIPMNHPGWPKRGIRHLEDRRKHAPGEEAVSSPWKMRVDPLDWLENHNRKPEFFCVIFLHLKTIIGLV